MKYQAEFEVAIHAVRMAARVCMSVQKTLGQSALRKEDRSPVTVADFGSQAVVCHVLEEAFPNDPVIGEEDAAVLHLPENESVLDKVTTEVAHVLPGATRESVCAWIDRGNGTGYSERFWTLDPIDGTKGFLRCDQYAVALALIAGGRIEVAAMACPDLPCDAEGGNIKGAVFAAHRGEGAVQAPLHGAGEPVWQPIRVRTVANGAQARLCEPFESNHGSRRDVAAVATHLGVEAASLRIDSQAKYGVLARGDADIYLRLTSRSGYIENIWDHAAGTLIVEEAGGVVTDMAGSPLDFRCGAQLERNTGIVATNGLLHEAVLEALADATG